MAELLAALLLLLVSFVWWAILVRLVVATVRWVFGENDDIHPQVLALSKLWLRVAYVQITCFLIWLILWIGSTVDGLNRS